MSVLDGSTAVPPGTYRPTAPSRAQKFHHTGCHQQADCQIDEPNKQQAVAYAGCGTLAWRHKEEPTYGTRDPSTPDSRHCLHLEWCAPLCLVKCLDILVRDVESLLALCAELWVLQLLRLCRGALLKAPCNGAGCLYFSTITMNAVNLALDAENTHFGGMQPISSPQ